MSGTDAREQAARPGGPAGPVEGLVPEQASGDRAAEAPPGTTEPAEAARAGQPAAGESWDTGLALGAPRRRRRGWIAALAVVVLVAAGLAGADAAGAFRTAKPAAGSNGYSTGTAVVKRTSLTSQTQENGTLGDAGSYTVIVPGSSASGAGGPGGSSSGSGPGTFTWLPAVGQTIRQGQVLYQVSETPVVLLYGSVPAYRDLSEGLTGGDVLELNTDLVKLGYATAAALGPRSGWDYFSGETAYALEQLQSHLGLTVTGSLPLGQAVFLPGPVQVTGLGTGVVPGASAAAGAVVLTGSSLTPVVTMSLDASQQTEVAVGDKVSITLPDGSVTPGVISQVSTAASASSSSSNSPSSGNGNGNGSGSGSGTATITVVVALTDLKAAGSLNQAPVEVTITTGSVSNVLVVPVDALLAQPGGGYAVEVTGPGGHHLVSVTPGLFDDAAGLVQVTGSGLSAGQHVVVPGI
ncbi:MAG TPA: peptidoglycan-binding protein [Streptosporangiaceae bacterium]|nr:peptidoglycan-binding protein [Streptosporangiaceae bacterium]